MHIKSEILVLGIITIALCACTGQQVPHKRPEAVMAGHADNNTLQDTSRARLTNMYIRAISDYLSEVSKQNLQVPEVLFVGKRKNGQPDDFPDILLPEKVQGVKVSLIAPELGEKVLKETPTSVYLNLMGWVDPEKANFIFVTFSNGFKHQFDVHLNYNYDQKQQQFALTTSRLEMFDKH